MKHQIQSTIASFVNSDKSIESNEIEMRFMYDHGMKSLVLCNYGLYCRCVRNL